MEIHESLVRKGLKAIQTSGEPNEFSPVWTNNLPMSFESLVDEYGLSMKWLKNVGRYFVYKPGKAYK
jgi:hypothetical protein